MEAKEININNYDLTDYKTVKNLVYMLDDESKRKTKTVDNLIDGIDKLIDGIDKLIKRIDNEGGES